MTKEIEKRAMALIRTLANRCERCLRRSEENCRPCDSAWANSILKDYEAESDSAAATPTFVQLCVKAVAALSGGKPLTASKIDLGPISPQHRYWVLTTLMRRGVVSRRRFQYRPKANVTYEYFLTPKTKTKKGNTK